MAAISPEDQTTESQVFLQNNVDWDYLLDSLKNEKCVLCLGPGVLANAGQTLENQLAAFLREEEKKLGIRVYDDGWFHYLPGQDEVKAWNRVKEFFTIPRSEAESVLFKIAQIPFHLILNFSPDYKMRDALALQTFPHNFISYVKNVPFDPNVQAPTKDNPLVLNMVGELNKRGSLVLTYNEFYLYMESVFTGKSMAPVLKESILDADYFVFMGMSFDRWYMHLFMRVLEQHDKKRKVGKYATNPRMDKALANSCNEQYTISFVPTEIGAFVEALHEHCKAEKILRTAPESLAVSLPLDVLRQLMVDEDFDNIFNIILQKLNEIGAAGRSWVDGILLMQGQFDSLKKKKMFKWISDEDALVATENLKKSLLELFRELEKLFKPNA